ncbi:hypothetical protein BJP36_35445 (plasmid) [Moorena producens JHB]|uniref:Uncharacterized protein n=1 Tax=Moorena producens (strain JHB) TaxID=1454205 RepID=A0A1D9GBM5_MOOP1|nr:hypothetical protein [Moorena producens]AOY85056.1 hypothetical protein BJP36_35445 [Moorena producens JHB]
MFETPYIEIEIFEFESRFDCRTITFRFLSDEDGMKMLADGWAPAVDRKYSLPKFKKQEKFTPGWYGSLNCLDSAEPTDYRCLKYWRGKLYGS